MRKYRTIERIGTLAIVQYLDNGKYAFKDLKTGKLGKSEFIELKHLSEFPFEKNDMVLNAEHFDLSKYHVVDKDGFYTLNCVGEFIYIDSLFDEVFTNIVNNGCESALEDMNFKYFEPGSPRFVTIKAAFNAYLDTVGRLYKVLEEMTDSERCYWIDYEKKLAGNVIAKKQEEYRDYLYNMHGDYSEVEDVDNPISIPINVIEMEFDNEPASENDM